DLKDKVLIPIVAKNDIDEGKDPITSGHGDAGDVPRKSQGLGESRLPLLRGTINPVSSHGGDDSASGNPPDLVGRTLRNIDVATDGIPRQTRKKSQARLLHLASVT